MDQASDHDTVDLILAQWARERPDLDTKAMGVLGRISRLAPSIGDHLQGVFTAFGLDFPSFDVMATLRRSGAPYQMTPSELATSMMITAGAVTQRLVRLEDQGLVTRSHDEHDRRRVIVSLSWRGVRLIDQALTEHAANERALLALYTDEEAEVLSSLLRRLCLALTPQE
ncbi:MAG: MarR family transcriptional regulator [Propionibacteriaceae bacterium]|nr:MarR family transcriptional regulator [Propionibacteriaceae bacterium]